MSKLFGFSLSRCVNDIAAGRIAYDDVEKIVARTAFSTDAEIEYGIASYKASAWVEQPEQCELIAKRLFAEGKVDQPRISGQPTPELPGGNFHWMNSETKEIVVSPEITEAAGILEQDRIWSALCGSPARKPGDKASPHGITIIALG